ncbi:hypothetical protein N665_0254s0004 [Sinapis alba]|nr:hypothetical protein N665_0254s0004 [Sinapis alba]
MVPFEPAILIYRRPPAGFLAGAVSSSSDSTSPYCQIPVLALRASSWNFSKASRAACLSLCSNLLRFSILAIPSCDHHEYQFLDMFL